jgi:hypothetical protein
MFCPSCGVATEPQQRFCNACGTALTTAAVSPGAMFPPPTTEQPAAPAASVDSRADTPTAAEPIIAVPAGEIPPIDSPAFDEMFETQKFRVVQQTTPTQEQISTTWEAGGTEWTGGVDSTDPVPRITEEATFAVAAPPAERGPAPLRSTMLVMAVAAAAVGVSSAFLTVLRYRVSGDVNATMRIGLNGISTNARVGTIVAAGLLVIGAALGLSGRRFGTGLAGGAGLALAGFMAWLAGDAVSIVDTLKRGFAESSYRYTLSTTLDVGFWMGVAAAVLGGVVFLLSFTGVGDDGRPSIHPAVGAVGLLGGLALVIGPMLPSNGATFADNFSGDVGIGPAVWWKSRLFLELGISHAQVPPVTTWLRVLLLLALVVGAYLGFIAGSRWGVGIVLGAIGIAVWQWLTSVLEAGDLPFGIAGGSPGQKGFPPNIVTTVGLVVVLLALIAGAVMAYRPRRADAATS